MISIFDAIRNIPVALAMVFVVVLSGCTDAPDEYQPTFGEFSDGQVLITEIGTTSSEETYVEIYIAKAERSGSSDQSFLSISSDRFLSLRRLGLMSYYREAGVYESRQTPYDFSFDRISSGQTKQLYEGVFYVLVFTNDFHGGRGEEIIEMTWEADGKSILPAVETDCLMMELYLTNDQNFRITQDFVLAGESCAQAELGPIYADNLNEARSGLDLSEDQIGVWNDNGVPLRFPHTEASLSRRVLLPTSENGENGFQFTPGVFQASDWERRSPTPGYPSDASCVFAGNGGIADQDRDGIPDCLEASGRTYFGMPLYEWGARPEQIDFFLEIDYMACAITNDPRTQPDLEVLIRLQDQFAQYSQRGQLFRLHIDVGNLWGDHLHSGFNLGGGNSIISAASERSKYWGINLSAGEEGSAGIDLFYGVKAEHFQIARKQLFFYMLMAETADFSGGQDSLAGIAEAYGNDTLLLLGGGGEERLRAELLDLFPDRCHIEVNDPDDIVRNVAKNYYQNTQALVALHEFGHNLGLNHGGAHDDPINNKPNYFSVMNYLYRDHGVPTGDDLLEIEKHVRDVYYYWAATQQSLDCYRHDHGANIRGVNFTGLDRDRGRLFGESQRLSVFWKNISDFNLSYSMGQNGPLWENALQETAWFTVAASGQQRVMALDVNCDGFIPATSARIDINFDETISSSSLNDFDDVAAIQSFFANLNQRRTASYISNGESSEPSLLSPQQKILSDRQSTVSVEEERAFHEGHGHAHNEIKLELIKSDSSDH